MMGTGRHPSFMRSSCDQPQRSLQGGAAPVLQAVVPDTDLATTDLNPGVRTAA